MGTQDYCSCDVVCEDCWWLITGCDPGLFQHCDQSTALLADRGIASEKTVIVFPCVGVTECLGFAVASQVVEKHTVAFCGEECFWRRVEDGVGEDGEGFEG